MVYSRVCEIIKLYIHLTEMMRLVNLSPGFIYSPVNYQV